MTGPAATGPGDCVRALDQSNLSAFLYWWVSSTPSSNGDNESLIQINGGTVTPSGRLWAFANFSNYVRPGAVRIAASDSSDSNITLDAFENTDGTIAIVALNTGTSPDPVTFSLSGTGTSNGATVTNPGTQTATVGTAATLQVQASDSASGQTRSYSASGMPAGLSISSSTGAISGTPTTQGTYNVTVSATDAARPGQRRSPGRSTGRPRAAGRAP